ncbi:C2H2 finger domain transcription factor crzA [Gracilariopsis chorda]|uniref:C2H2 finger domain transcription factor crzA n=1 Tax=Gracilariopsis chorda TaxID=448386 RepID=A0A2V3IMT5_9FLOR|nr:C2H2 finger domain transcription factor crzA [Gracilariopsis chorda]|eukprot:PXF43388.1 C2H2 finger domain transcription factor crzA [Gracilariopsis chorda]
MDVADHSACEPPLVFEDGTGLFQMQQHFYPPVADVTSKASSSQQRGSGALNFSDISRPMASIGKNRRTKLEGKGSHPCPYALCQRSFSTKYNAKAHLRVHTDEKPFMCSLGCGECFKWGSSKKNHQANKCPLRRIAKAVNIQEVFGENTFTDVRSMELISMDTNFPEGPETDLSTAFSSEGRQQGVSISADNSVSRSNDLHMFEIYQKGLVVHGTSPKLVQNSHCPFVSKRAPTRNADASSRIARVREDTTNTAIPDSLIIETENNVIEGLNDPREDEQWHPVKSCGCDLPCQCCSIFQHWEINGAFF